MTVKNEEKDGTIATFEETALSSAVVVYKRLGFAVSIVSRAIVPTLLNFYYSFLRNQQILFNKFYKRILPFIVNFILNRLVHKLRQPESITYLPQDVDQHGGNNTTNDDIPERSVELSILYQPEEEIEADIIFIHGLHGGLNCTWTQGQWKQSMKAAILRMYSRYESKDFEYIASLDEWNIGEMDGDGDKESFSGCWPRDWIKLDCPGVRVIALNYDTDILWCPMWIKKRKRTGMVARSDEMIEKLLSVGVGEKPIIWVGHSKGGLYIKQIILNAVERNPHGRVDILNIWRQTKAIMFYSVPHRGSILADMDLPFFRKSIEVLEIQDGCDFIMNLDKRFIKLIQCGEFNPEIFSFIETSYTMMSILCFKIVSYASADLGIGRRCGVELDHREICKPAGRDCLLYTELIELIRRALKNNS